MNKIIKPDDASSSGLSLNKGKLTSRASPFQQRVSQAKREEVDPTTMPNRICIMLDKSSSMSTMGPKSQTRIELCKLALQNFVQRCNLKDTAIAIDSFPEGFEFPLSSNGVLLS